PPQLVRDKAGPLRRRAAFLLHRRAEQQLTVQHHLANLATSHLTDSGGDLERVADITLHAAVYFDAGVDQVPGNGIGPLLRVRMALEDAHLHRRASVLVPGEAAHEREHAHWAVLRAQQVLHAGAVGVALCLPTIAV